jgi:hypothetical protein
VRSRDPPPATPQAAAERRLREAEAEAEEEPEPEPEPAGGRRSRAVEALVAGDAGVESPRGEEEDGLSEPARRGR